MFRPTIHRTLRLARPLSSTSAVQTATETINRRVGQTLASGLGMAQHAMEEAAKPDDTGFPTPEADAAAASPIDLSNLKPTKSRPFPDDVTGFPTPEAEEAAVAAESYTPSDSAEARSEPVKAKPAKKHDRGVNHLPAEDADW